VDFAEIRGFSKRRYVTDLLAFFREMLAIIESFYGGRNNLNLATQSSSNLSVMIKPL
jgi:hypothetical protein